MDGLVENERKLVEHDEFGPRHERAGDREHLLLAARQRAGRLLPPFGEPRDDASSLKCVVCQFSTQER